MLFIHRDADSYVPYSDSVKYSEIFKNSKLVTIKGGEHGFHDNKNKSEKADSETMKFLLENI
jgi:hypothetical protein